jgi:PAS domain S-box-containing protein
MTPDDRRRQKHSLSQQGGSRPKALGRTSPSAAPKDLFVERALFHDCPTGIAFLGSRGEIQRANPSFAAILRCSPSDLRGKIFSDFFVGKSSGAPLSPILEVIASDGARVWIAVKESSSRSGSGKRLSRVIFVEDITERRRTAGQLLFQTSLLDHVRNAVIATDAEGRIVYWNKFAEKLYQWRSEEVLGRNVVEVTVPEGGANRAVEIFQTLMEKGSWEGEFTVKRKDGVTFAAHVVDATMRDATGQVSGYIGVSMDITERKRAAEEIQHSQEQLRALAARVEGVREKERAHIAREIHDELGQALTGLKIDLSWAANKIAEEPPSKRRAPIVEKIGAMIESVDATIQHVRKITTELRPRILDEFGVAAAIEWQARDFQTRTGIHCHFFSNVERITLNDERATAMFRIFQEALTNILRHAHSTRVDVSLMQDRDGLRLEVKDDGKGIPNAKVFDAHSLGLLGMRERAALARGQLSVRGIRGKGTTVVLWLPLKRSPRRMAIRFPLESKLVSKPKEGTS